MDGYDFNGPFVDQEVLPDYWAIDQTTADLYGKVVKAVQLSNVEYKIRFNRFARKNNMKPPPSAGRIFSGYLVVRNLTSSNRYETWMPDHVFEDLYELAP